MPGARCPPDSRRRPARSPECGLPPRRSRAASQPRLLVLVLAAVTGSPRPLDGSAAGLPLAAAAPLPSRPRSPTSPPHTRALPAGPATCPGPALDRPGRDRQGRDRPRPPPAMISGAGRRPRCSSCPPPSRPTPIPSRPAARNPAHPVGPGRRRLRRRPAAVRQRRPRRRTTSAARSCLQPRRRYVDHVLTSPTTYAAARSLRPDTAASASRKPPAIAFARAQLGPRTCGAATAPPGRRRLRLLRPDPGRLRNRRHHPPPRRPGPIRPAPASRPAPTAPGDLVFYGTPSHLHHVGLYTGDGRDDRRTTPSRSRPPGALPIRRGRLPRRGTAVSSHVSRRPAPDEAKALLRTLTRTLVGVATLAGIFTAVNVTAFAAKHQTPWPSPPCGPHGRARPHGGPARRRPTRLLGCSAARLVSGAALVHRPHRDHHEHLDVPLA